MKESNGRGLLHDLIRCLVWICLSVCGLSAQTTISHAHNDYEKPNPLWNALQHKFQSIEIDIARLDNTLKVTHTLDSLQFKPTLEDMYFDPLQSHLDTASISLWLLVDLKSFDYETLDLLHERVKEKDDLFVRRGETLGERPLQLILSGDIPRAEIIAEKKYVYFFLDGRIENLGQGYSTEVMPLISANFSEISDWLGVGSLSEVDRKTLVDLVHRVKQEQKKLRFWKTAESEVIWDTLIELGVDVIGTDEVDRLARYIAGP